MRFNQLAPALTLLAVSVYMPAANSLEVAVDTFRPDGSYVCCTGYAVGPSGGPWNYVQALPFTSLASGLLLRFDVAFGWTAFPRPPVAGDEFRFSVQTDNLGQPNDDEIASWTIPALSLNPWATIDPGSGTFYSTFFSTEISETSALIAGTSYWLVASSSTMPGVWNVATVESAGRRCYKTDPAGSWNCSEFQWPGALRLYVASVPEPGTIALLCLGLAGLGLSRRRKAA